MLLYSLSFSMYKFAYRSSLLKKNLKLKLNINMQCVYMQETTARKHSLKSVSSNKNCMRDDTAQYCNDPSNPESHLPPHFPVSQKKDRNHVRHADSRQTVSPTHNSDLCNFCPFFWLLRPVSLQLSNSSQSVGFLAGISILVVVGCYKTTL